MSALVFERMDTDLLDLIVSRNPNDYPVYVDQVVSFGKQLFKALEFLQSINIIHMDLKPGMSFCSYLTKFLIALTKIENIMIKDVHRVNPKYVCLSPSSSSFYLLMIFLSHSDI